MLRLNGPVRRNHDDQNLIVESILDLYVTQVSNYLALRFSHPPDHLSGLPFSTGLSCHRHRQADAGVGISPLRLSNAYVSAKSALTIGRILSHSRIVRGCLQQLRNMAANLRAITRANEQPVLSIADERGRPWPLAQTLHNPYATALPPLIQNTLRAPPGQRQAE